MKHVLMKRVISIFHYQGKNRDQDETHRRTMEVLTSRDDTGEAAEDEATLNERRLLSKYGVWLLAGNRVM